MWIYIYAVGGIIVALSILWVKIRREGEMTLQDAILLPVFAFVYPAVIAILPILLIEFGSDIVLWSKKEDKDVL